MVTSAFQATVEEDTASNTLNKLEYTDLLKVYDEIFKPPSNKSTSVSEVNEDHPAESQTCQCVPFYLCVNDTVQINGENLIDIRMPKQNLCTDPLEMCCNNIMRPPLISDVPIESYDASAIPKCGQTKTGGGALSKLIEDSNKSKFGHFPWFVAIYEVKEDAANDRFLCSGSLIHPKVVLTAVHCIIDTKLNQLKVHAGGWETQTENYRLVVKIIKHSEFYGCGRQNDIALLIVNVPYDLHRDNVGTLCLPSLDYTFTSDQRCQYAKRGEKLLGRDNVFYVLVEKVDAPIVQRDKCIKMLRRTRLGSGFCLHESFICTGGKIDKNICKSDGGGPVMCPVQGNPGQVQQVGIVSWSIGCDGSTPSVHVNVAKFRQWIDYQMLYHNLNPAYYDPKQTAS